MEILDGKKLADEILGELILKIRNLADRDIKPKLAIILAENDPASEIYIKAKIKAADRIGIAYEVLRSQGEDISTSAIVGQIRKLNEDKTVNGILVQLPLPQNVSVAEVLEAIDPAKDVDGLTPFNVGRTLRGMEFEDMTPCTPLGVIKMLDNYGISVTGKKAVVVGASNLVGKPMMMMLLNRRATMTICHSKTTDLAEHTRTADILVSAVGKINLITAEMVKDGAVVIDIGINRTVDGKIVGDVDFENVAPKTSYISPVPGGVGPMTVACLMTNIVNAAMRQAS